MGETADGSQEGMQAAATRLLDNVVKPLKQQFNKPIVIGVAYPSASNLQEQALAYQSILLALNGSEWIAGFISRGYFPPAALQDESTSVHGKPASDVLKYWFPRLLGISPP